jgi:diguanylate cyclase (GGDEF)-like protein
MTMPAPRSGTSMAGASDGGARRYFAGFDVLAEIGRGAQAVVYRVARDSSEFALKVLRPGGPDDASRVVAFCREAALLACVNHPGLARVYEVGVADGRPYLVMDVVEGQRLTDVLISGALSEARVVALGIDLAGALVAAHQTGLVHRDVKPDNVVLAVDGTARLIDFGLATRVSEEQDEPAAGTLAYSAPEQSGVLHRPVDGRADLYALGAVLFECATGEPPFAAQDVGELRRLHAVAPVPDPRELRAELSPALAAILGRLLAKDPDDRYQSASGLLADLQRLAAEPGAGAFDLGTADEPVGTRREAPLIGRDAELAVLRERWHRVLGGHGQLVLLRGAAGSGKSRLARELAAEVQGAGQLVLRGKSAANDAQPLAPLRSAIDEHVRCVRRLPEPERAVASQRLVAAAGQTAPLLRNLSPELAELLDVPEASGEVAQEQFAVAVAAFLAELARLCGGALLYLDDVQWLDDVTLGIVRHIAAELSGAPLLVIAAGRDDAAPDSIGDAGHLQGALAAVIEIMHPLLPQSATVVGPRPLDAEGVAQLVAAVSGGMKIDAETSARLAARSDGNPFTLLEYVNAIVDAGLVRPSWGTWRVDGTRLGDLELPRDAAELVLKRIDALDVESRHVLAVAAVVGSTFTIDLVAAVCGRDQPRVQRVVADATWHHLVERQREGEYLFLHDRIPEVLLAQFDEAALRQLHDRIAEAIDQRHDDDPQTVYALAHHCVRGEVNRDPARVFRICEAAGRRALADHAPAQAQFFLERAASMAKVAGIEPDVRFLKVLGVAYHRAGRFDDAVDTLRRALAAAASRFERAKVLDLIARVHLSIGDTAAQLDAVEQALSELGRRLARNRVLLLASATWLFLLGCLVGVTGIGYGKATGRKRSLYLQLASLYEVAASAYVRDLHGRKATILGMRAVYLVNRAGSLRERAHARAGLAFLARRAGWSRIAEREAAIGAAMAAELGDPRHVAYVAWLTSMAKYSTGMDAGESLMRVMEEQGRWLDVGNYLDCFRNLAWDRLLRGDMLEAEEWFQRRRARLLASGEVGPIDVIAVEVGLPALRGRAGEAATRLQKLRDSPEPPIWQRLDVLVATLQLALEQGDVGSTFDSAVAEFEGLVLNAAQLFPSHQAAYVYLAYGRVEQCRGTVATAIQPAAAEDRPARFAAAKGAVSALEAIAVRPLLAAHHRVLRAALLEIGGDPEAALTALVEADPALRTVDAPLVAFEAARVRARALRALGVGGEADRQAGYAMSVAIEQGWPHRARWISAEFGHYATPSVRSRGPVRGGDTLAPDMYRERLAALEQVSLAASRGEDPDKLARMALDEIIRILGAERAFIFLLDGEGDEPRLASHLGRDTDGNDLRQLSAYSMTLVEQAFRGQQPIVVSGTDESELLGSRGAVVHGLRSILVAPIRLDDRPLGVVYLDSRVAKGLFTIDDISILTAITNHVAVALASARTAELEVAVEAAHRQRNLADTVREAMSELSGTLHPDIVLWQLLATAQWALGGEKTWLLAHDPATSTVSLLVSSSTHENANGAGGNGAGAGGAGAIGSTETNVESKPAGHSFAVDAEPGLTRLFEATAPVIGGEGEGWLDTLAGGALTVRSWLAIPLTVNQQKCVLLLGDERRDAYDDGHVDIAVGMAGQGMIAYENARLFTQARQQATVDSLTGVGTRRHFLDVAAREVAAARRHRRSLAAIMIDIDHFKRINDTYGHQVGDEVISAVATKIRRYGAEDDLTGRYGGEEFVLLVCGAKETVPGVAERLRAEIADVPVQTSAGPINVTISAGAAYLEQSDTEPDTVLARADQCLYQAKRAGRNRVVVDGGGRRPRAIHP